MKLRRIMFEMRFNPTLSFLNKLLVIGENLTEDFPEWETDNFTVILKNSDKKNNFIISSDKIGFSMDDPPDSDCFLSKIKKGVNIYTDKVTLTKANRIGIRFKYLKKVNFNFEELVEIITEKLYKDNGKFIFTNDTGEYLDIAYVSHIKMNDFEINLTAGPLKKEEILSHITPGFNEYFDKTNESDTSIFMDIDCYKKDESNIGPDNIFNIVKDSYNLSRNIADNFSTYLLGENHD